MHSKMYPTSGTQTKMKIHVSRCAITLHFQLHIIMPVTSTKVVIFVCPSSSIPMFTISIISDNAHNANNANHAKNVMKQMHKFKKIHTEQAAQTIQTL